ncbi:MAG: folate family ECF transporter S component [Spirochaetaceae bacterium]|jgi:ECF transporter S component (folate family)|nr:folate family ECF transporter S component [Spirochaetaceae bacterium]
MSKVKHLSLAGLLLATLILFERFISFDSQLLRLSFAYVPYILAGWLLGPVWAGVIGVCGDLLGMLLMPKSSFFAGFTLNAFLTGFIYGFFLHNKKINKKTCGLLLLSLLLVHIFVHLGLTTLWLSIMYKKAFFVIITGRIIANVIELPIEFASMIFIFRFLEKPVNLFLRDVNKDGDAVAYEGDETIGENKTDDSPDASKQPPDELR